jgi:hypothetical protein
MKTSCVLIACLAMPAMAEGQVKEATAGAPANEAPMPRAAGAVATSKIPDDLRLLAGKHVIVGRLPLCVPNSYATNMAYTGKSATVISFNRTSRSIG